MKKIIFTALILFSFSQIFAAATEDAGFGSTENTNGVDRYAVFIGSNKGGQGREQLLYAGSDAQSFQKTMTEIGGVTDSNSYVLIDPTKEKIDETLNQISKKINTSTSTAKRSEFIFYYSGHSDENALLLGDTPYDYSTLKAAITNVPSDIHVVILDSCYSGNFIRTKGGQKRKPFLLDDSSVVSGHAYLSSALRMMNLPFASFERESIASAVEISERTRSPEPTSVILKFGCCGPALLDSVLESVSLNAYE